MQAENHFGNLKVGDFVDTLVGVLSRKVDTDRNGAKYLKWTLVDASGTQVGAKRWKVQPAEIAETEGLAWARVCGKVTEYRGTLEIEVTCPLSEVDPPNDALAFLPASPVPLDELRSRLHAYIESVRQPHLNALLRAVFCEDAKLARLFETLPAAEMRHHAFRHGLLQHTLEVADTVEAIAAKQRNWGDGRGRFSRDLAVTGALLHDLGKLEEYESDGLGVRFSSGGGLLGHVTLGVVTVTRKIAQVGKNKLLKFPKELEELVQHTIASHHGKPEYGAPRPPMTAEAALIHYADMLSTELFYFAQAESQAAEGAVLHKQWQFDGGGRTVYVGKIGCLWGEQGGAPTFGNGIAEDAHLPKLFPSTTGNNPVSSFPASLPLLRLVRSRDIEINFATVKLPLVGKVAAGEPIFDSANIEDDLLVEAEGLGIGRGNYYLLRVQGDSMIGDGIFDGDMIVVRYQEQAEWGDIVVASIDGAATVKRLINQNGRINLQASNPDFAPILVPDSESLSIQGRVVGIAR